MSGSNASQILNQIRDSKPSQRSGNAGFATNTITLSDGAVATRLFERIAVSKKILGLIAPQKLKRENELAFDTLAEAVQTRFPAIQGNQVMASLGIRKGESVSLRKLKDFGVTIDNFKNAANTKDIHAGSSALKNRFDQYRLQNTPGLVAFTQLSSEDLSLLGRYSVSGKVQDLESFQKFVGASMDLTVLKTGGSAAEQRAILNFIFGWCQMNENERSSLKSSLSVNGQAAFEAISILVNKMVAVDKFPVTQQNSLGLDRPFARSRIFQYQRRHIKAALANNQAGTSKTETATRLQCSANILGKSLGEKWAAAHQNPRNHMGLESQTKAPIRSFLDVNMPLVLKEIPDSQKAAAGAEWLLNKEAFISTMAKAATAALIGNKVGDITNDQITIGSHTYEVGKTLAEGGKVFSGWQKQPMVKKSVSNLVCRRQIRLPCKLKSLVTCLHQSSIMRTF